MWSLEAATIMLCVLAYTNAVSKIFAPTPRLAYPMLWALLVVIFNLHHLLGPSVPVPISPVMMNWRIRALAHADVPLGLHTAWDSYFFKLTVSGAFLLLCETIVIIIDAAQRLFMLKLDFWLIGDIGMAVWMGFCSLGTLQSYYDVATEGLAKPMASGGSVELIMMILVSMVVFLLWGLIITLWWIRLIRTH